MRSVGRHSRFGVSVKFRGTSRNCWKKLSTSVEVVKRKLRRLSTVGSFGERSLESIRRPFSLPVVFLIASRSNGVANVVMIMVRPYSVRTHEIEQFGSLESCCLYRDRGQIPKPQAFSDRDINRSWSGVLRTSFNLSLNVLANSRRLHA